jgi:hypothetical protein
VERGKDRAGAGVREKRLGMLTPEDARELELEPKAPDPLPWPHCGKPLGRLGINVGGRVLWVSHEPCGCPGELAVAAEAKALEAAKAAEERRARV